MNQTKSRQVDNKPTKQIRIDTGLHKLLKVEAARSGRTIKGLVEESLMDLLGVQAEEV